MDRPCVDENEYDVIVVGAGPAGETVAGRVKVRVPLVGRSAERAILGGFTTQLGREAVALAAWCAANPSGG